MYKIIPWEEYSNWGEVSDGMGGTYHQYTCPYWYTQPHAQVNPQKTEVLIACEDGDLTYEAMLEYVEAHWNPSSSSRKFFIKT